MRQRLFNLVAIGLLIGASNLSFSSGRLKWAPTAAADADRLVSVYADGHKTLFSTNASTIRAVLQQAGVTLGHNDLVEPGLDATLPPTGPYNINVYRARPVLVIDGLQSHRVLTAYRSPRLIAGAAGLTVYPEDQLTTSTITNFVDAQLVGEQIVIKRATPFVVKVDGTSRSLRTQATSIAGALESADIAVGPQDTVKPALSKPLIGGTVITITRVSEVVATVTQTIPRLVKTIADPKTLKGTSRVQDPGADGQKTTTFKIHYTNGIETSRQAIKQVSETAPKTKVVVEGTKVMFAGNIEHWRPMVESAAAAYGLDPNMMLRIMACESNGNATAVSTFIVNGQHPTGLFQYLPTTWTAAGGTNDNIFDGALQIKLTAKKMAREGTSAWQCQ